MGIQIKKQEQLSQLQEFEIQQTAIFAGIVRTRELVALRSIVEKLGLGWANTYEKMKRDKYWNQLFLESEFISKDGRCRKMMCLGLMELQEWLFKYEFPNSVNQACLQDFRYRLVIEIQHALMAMLKVSMEEIRQLRAVNNLHQRSKAIFDEYLQEDEKAKELLSKGKDHQKRAAELKAQYLEVSTSNQLDLFENQND